MYWQFTPPNLTCVRLALPREQLAWAPLGVRGRVYVASEGINAQMAVPCTSTERFERAVEAIEKLAGV